MITIIAVGVQDNGGGVEVIAKNDLVHGFTAVTNIVFAYSKYCQSS